jgi:hypothetical protein
MGRCSQLHAALTIHNALDFLTISDIIERSRSKFRVLTALIAHASFPEHVHTQVSPAVSVS